VTGEAGADLFVRRNGVMAARVAGYDVGDSYDLVEDGFEAPEAAAGKDGLIELRVRVDCHVNHFTFIRIILVIFIVPTNDSPLTSGMKNSSFDCKLFHDCFDVRFIHFPSHSLLLKI
jgi:hypothetical protein